jgi:hypothetical protein
LKKNFAALRAFEQAEDAQQKIFSTAVIAGEQIQSARFDRERKIAQGGAAGPGCRGKILRFE